jgi:hypothetical protein
MRSGSVSPLGTRHPSRRRHPRQDRLLDGVSRGVGAHTASDSFGAVSRYSRSTEFRNRLTDPPQPRVWRRQRVHLDAGEPLQTRQ